MIGVQALIVSCCLVAQAAESPSLPPPGLSKRKFESAPPAGQAPAGQDRGRGRSAYDRDAGQPSVEQLRKDVDAVGGMAGDRPGEMGDVGSAPRQLRPPELLADALAGPHEGPLRAEPVPLVDALARAAIARRSGGSR